MQAFNPSPYQNTWNFRTELLLTTQPSTKATEGFPLGGSTLFFRMVTNAESSTGHNDTVQLTVRTQVHNGPKNVTPGSARLVPDPHGLPYTLLSGQV